MYTAHAGIELYAEIFGANNALDKLQGFASVFGPSFYGLPLNVGTVTLKRSENVVPEEIAGVVPFQAGETLHWRMVAGRGD